jgi:tricorn protease
MPAGGGTARRLTFHSDVVQGAPTRWGPDNMVVTWTPDSKNIVFLSRRMAFNSWFGRLFTVPVQGGLQQPLPLDRGGLMTYAPDGHTIAYNRIFRNFRTWKRYLGGLSQHVYTYDFQSKKLTDITNWSGTNTAPMWYGQHIYFLSDRDSKRRANIWVYDIATKQFREITHFTNYDIDFPSLGAGGRGGDGIVFAQAGALWVIDLPSEKHAPDRASSMPARASATSIRRTTTTMPSRPTASGRSFPRAAICSPCRPNMARRATSPVQAMPTKTIRRGRPTARLSPIRPM